MGVWWPTWTTPPELAAQNVGTAWVDCTRRGRPHLLAERQRVGDAAYLRCRRCAVDVRITRG
jgi:hypothetical protein